MFFIKNEEHGSAALPGEAVLLNSDTGHFFRLEEVGLSIWSKIDGPTHVEQISAGIQHEYDVPGDQCLADVTVIL